MWTERRSAKTNQRGLLDKRTPYERDRTRVIHSPSFRRLQGKTQILGTQEGEFHRTRLTHSLEVSSIGSAILRHLHSSPSKIFPSEYLPNEDLISVICLLHDIGHPPFGHGGETALNYMMRDHGGFEGNAQSLRLLTKTETCYGPFGLDLTRRALLGILKYPIPWTKAKNLDTTNSLIHPNRCINHFLPPKAYYDSEQEEIDWLLSVFKDEEIVLFQSLSVMPTPLSVGKAAYHAFDCSIMDIADDIAYGVHDLEDAIHLNLIHRHHLDTADFHQLLIDADFTPNHHEFLHLLFNPSLDLRKQAIGELVNYLITATQITINDERFDNFLLKYKLELKAPASKLLDYLIASIFQYVINSQSARIFEHGGQTIILKLFEALQSNPRHLLDAYHRELFENAGSEKAATRLICDYIANMTDEQATRIYKQLYGLNQEKIF